MNATIEMPAALALADGTVFHGVAFGAKRGPDRAITGEVVFNTSMYGYQEILSDPSYAGQIMCFTYPHIGNVGCNDEDNESRKAHVEGIIVRNLSRVVSNFRARRSLPQYLEEQDIMGVSGIDTRKIVSHLRDNGAQMGAMACGPNLNVSDLVDVARSKGSMLGKDYVQHVSCVEPYSWDELPWALNYRASRNLSQEQMSTRPHVVVLDCGVKYNILRLLLDTGFRVTVVPSTTPAEKILSYNPDALFLSNGPGDPATLGYVVKNVKSLLGRFPVFGICLGHQVMAQAFGGKTYKLKFGHRGGNHPVMNNNTKGVEITVQNHGFAVDRDSLPADVGISHINLNDQTIEGLEVPELRAFCVQYHPEASPGPHDSKYLFTKFFELVVGYNRRS